MSDDQPLQLDRFLPYRLSVLANTSSGALARIYSARFGITIPEWRVMAVLGLGEDMSANTVCSRTAMDKVQVSRAIARLIEAGHVARTIDAADRRRAVLRLTASGTDIYNQIVPAARGYEQRLMGVLNESEQTDLDALLAKLLERAREIDEQGG